MQIQRNVMVKMRDGVRLATDIYLPTGWTRGSDQRFPAVIERTPYGKEVTSRSERTHLQTVPLTRAEVARNFVDRGYVVVYQDCRGRYDSEGEFIKYISDAADGYDTCAWIVEQPWSNRSIGAMGLSYAAHTQMAAASLGAPGLRAMVVDSGGFSNAYASGVRQGGAYELKQAAWAVMFATQHSRRATSRGAALTPQDLDRWFKRMPWRRGDSPLSATPDYEDFLFDQWEHGEFDGYWRQPGLYAQGYYDTIKNAPAIHISSWYDVYPRTAIDNYLGTTKHGGTARLILGPWTHGNRWETHSGDVDFGAVAQFEGNVAPSFMDLRLQWFDRWLKNEPSGADLEPEVMIFVMGGGSGRRNGDGRLDHGGRWKAEPTWPPLGTKPTRFDLHESGKLTAEEPSPSSGHRTFRYDPADPTITLGGSVVARPPSILAGGYDQIERPEFFGCRAPGRPLASRPDVLVFESTPLVDDVEVTGEIETVLWVSSDCLDTDFTAKLVDVYPPNADYPDGYALNITDGILRARYRDSWEHPALLEPGKVYCISIKLFPTSNLFKRGHRIRLDVSSSNFPKFDLNTNTGEPEAKATRMRVATNTVHMGGATPSHVVLPIVPRLS